MSDGITAGSLELDSAVLNVLGATRESGAYTVSAVLHLNARKDNNETNVTDVCIDSFTAPTRKEAWAAMCAWAVGLIGGGP